jgi:zinc protease
MLAQLSVGVPDSSGLTLQERMRERGVVLEVDVSRDRVWYSIRAPREALEWALLQLHQALTVPDIDPGRLELVRRQMIADLTRAQADPERLRELAVWQVAYGARHPYARPVIGDRESLNEITVDDLRALHRSQYRPESMFLVLSGDVRARKSRSLVRGGSGRSRPPVSESHAPRPTARDAAPQARVLLVDLPGASQAHLSVVSRCRGEDASLDSATLVMNTLLGGAAGSRLYRTLRGQYGYAYAASSRLVTSRQGTYLSAETTVDVADAPDAVRLILSELEGLLDEPEPDEVVRARRHRESSLLALFETNRSIARLRARLVTLAIDPGRLEELLGEIPEVEPHAIVLAAARCVDPGRTSVVVVGDRRSLELPLEELDVGSVRVVGAEGMWAVRPNVASQD